MSYNYGVKPEQRHPIRYVAHLAGLTPHVIRAWERRYGAVAPVRTSTNRRLYSEADIERLRLLRKAINAGHSIGQLARLKDEDLLALLSEEERTRLQTEPVASSPLGKPSAAECYDQCVSAVSNLDGPALESALTLAAVHLSRPLIVEEVIIPLIQRMGDLWSEGSLRILHEHMASSVLRTFLGDMLRASEAPLEAPIIVATTPVGQLHELGALIVAVTAASDGWRAMYLGPNLPAEEIAGAVDSTAARVVALSIVYPSGDTRLVRDLRRLGRYLSGRVALIAGGRAADSYRETLDMAGFILLEDMPRFRSQLKSLVVRERL